jgi:hypothetical protein
MYSEQFKQVDCTILYSGALSAGVGSSIDTTSYGSVVVQLIGQGLIEATIEGSNDNTTWNTVVLNQFGDIGSPVDSMTMPTGYQFRTSYQYIRYNAAYVSGTFTITIIGRSGPGPAAADSLAAAFNKDTPLNVETGLKKDQSGALVLSDVLYSILVPRTGTAITTTTFTVDCLGYASWSLTNTISSLTIGGIQVSNDGLNWANIATYYISGTSDAQYIGAIVTSTNTNVNHRYGSVFFRYLRFSISGNTNTSVDRPATTLLLKTINASPVVQSDILINGIRPAAGAVGGFNVLSIGGIQISGSSGGSKNFPVMVGGVIDGLSATSNSTFGAARYFSLDGYGRTNIGINSPYFPGSSNTTIQPTAVSPPSRASNPLNVLGSIPATVQGSAALNVQETSQFEGQSILELLAQILVDLRIANQQVYELPRLIANNQQYLDSPESFRQEQSAFNQ